MKSILIVTHTMELGGAERALIGLLNSIDYSKYSVDLFLERHFGELLEYIPEEVNLLEENPKYSCMAIPITDVIKKGKLLVAAGRLEGKLRAGRYTKRHKYFTADVSIEYSQKYTVKHMPMISQKRYDLAVSFLTPHYFTAQKVIANKKIAWIHSDYEAFQVDISSELKMWSAFDKIVSISDKVTESFLKSFPTLKEKIVLVENIHPAKFICSQAEEFSADKDMPKVDGELRFLSVGRFSHQKNFDNLPFIAKKMVEDGIKFKWYIIGYGTDGDIINRSIEESGMKDTVIVLGKRANPYPYMKACDFYIQPSRFEGNAVTVNEALILKKKVVVTNYATAESQIKDGVNGVIVPLENEQCANGIEKFIADNNLQNSISDYIKNVDFSHKEEVKKIYAVLEDN